MKRENLIIIGVSLLAVGTGVYLSHRLSKKPVSGNGDEGDDTTDGYNPNGGIIGKNQVKGRRIYILPNEQYANVRKNAEIDNIPPDNILARYYRNKKDIPSKWNVLEADKIMDLNLSLDGNEIGIIKDVTQGEDGWNWYKIQLRVPADGVSEGFVREDAVKIG